MPAIDETAYRPSSADEVGTMVEEQVGHRRVVRRGVSCDRSRRWRFARLLPRRGLCAIVQADSIVKY